MSAATAILVTLVVYKVVLLAIGFVAERWTRDQADFVLGGRGLGPLVAAISASASSSSVWTLLGVSMYAYNSGLSAIWLFPACVGGFALNWYVIAPRLRRHSLQTGTLTLTEVLAGSKDRSGYRAIMVLASLMILFALMVYVAAQLQGAGKLFSSVLEDLTEEPPSATWMIIVGAAIVVAYTILGGFWAVSITDTLQGLMMALTAVVLPIAAVAELGMSELWSGIGNVEDAGFDELFGDRAGFAACIGFVAGLLGIGLGYPGQPHVVNRFMALRDDAAVVSARRYAMAWAILVYTGMITLGLAGRVLHSRLGEGEEIFFVLTTELFSPVIAGVMVAAVLSAIMSTADSQLLVGASSITNDLAPGRGNDLARSRIVVLLLTAASVAAAVVMPKEIFDNVLFAWAAMGAAFGPVLFFVLWKGGLSAPATLATMVVGFVAAVSAHVAGAPGWVKQVVPYVLAFVVAIAMRARR